MQSGYQIIQPFITPTQSAGNFTLSTITIDRLLSNVSLTSQSYPGHSAFEVLEGQLYVLIESELLSLLQGDVVFIPGNISYQYYSKVAFTKFLHIGQGSECLDTALIANSTSWDSPVWPTYA
jgi:quercetin dioxygenase-like cupin family protein